MSNETMEWLNDGTKIKLGFTDSRGELYAWHHNEYAAAIAAENNGGAQQYYTGAIPLSAVLADILNWHAETSPVQYVTADGRTIETTDQVIYRNDSGAAFKTGFKDGYKIHQFDDLLIEKTAIVTGLSVADVVNINNGTAGDMLQIGTVGLLQDGAVFWAQFELPETLRSVKHGLEYRTSLMLGSSHNGTVATQWGLPSTLIVCDNTFAYARGEAKSHAVKVKHTKYSNSAINSAGDALGLVNSAADDFGLMIDELIETKVSGAQFVKFIDAYVPVPEADGRGKTMAENKRDTLSALYMNDPRVAPYAGSAFGVLQMTNTFNQHIASIHSGTDRTEKRYSDLLTGKLADRDAATMELLGGILANA